jgi:hypothetical protein
VSDAPTTPPPELELERVAAFERQITCTGENDARLARLLELLNWSVDGTTE